MKSYSMYRQKLKKKQEVWTKCFEEDELPVVTSWLKNKQTKNPKDLILSPATTYMHVNVIKY